MSRTFLLTIAALSVAFIAVLTACQSYPTCSTDDDCAEQREYCSNQKCGQCRTNAHCPEGRSCVEGSCERLDKWCKIDSDCPGKHRCRDGVCGDECENNAECPTSSTCMQGECH